MISIFYTITQFDKSNIYLHSFYFAQSFPQSTCHLVLLWYRCHDDSHSPTFPCISLLKTKHIKTLFNNAQSTLNLPHIKYLEIYSSNIKNLANRTSRHNLDIQTLKNHTLEHPNLWEKTTFENFKGVLQFLKCQETAV